MVRMFVCTKDILTFQLNKLQYTFEDQENVERHDADHGEPPNI